MKKILYHAFMTLAMISALTALGLSCYWLGHLDGALDPAREVERAMCLNRETALRESPTGYILTTIPADAQIWLMDLDLPFAHVAYYEGGSWIEGTITASALEVCR